MKKIILSGLLLLSFSALFIESSAVAPIAVQSKIPKKVENALNNQLGGITYMVYQFGGLATTYVSEQGRTDHGNYYFYYDVWVDPSSGVFLYPQSGHYIEIRPNGEVVEATLVYISFISGF